jgi:AraC family transcriptional regulator
LDTVGITEFVGRQFHVGQAATVIALARPTKIPIIFSHVRSATKMPEKTLAPRVENAFAFHLHHRPIISAETWIGDIHADLPPVAAGGLCIFDLQTSPVAIVHEPFDFSRFYMARTTLDDLTYSSGLPRVRDLRVPEFGHADPVIQNLALAMIARIEMLGDEVDSLFADWIAHAFHEHVVRVYGEAPDPRPWRGGLTPRRLHLVSELMTERMADPLSIPWIAARIDMAPSHFARAFRQATGEPPHKWLMHKRIERAKALLRSPEMGLAEIAQVCGFVDQSHMTRVFSRIERLPPGAWRRLHRI